MFNAVQIPIAYAVVLPDITGCPCGSPTCCVFAIDPGTFESGWVKYCRKTKTLIDKGISPNDVLVEMILAGTGSSCLAVEGIVGYGKKVGMSTFRTCEWIGEFRLAWRIYCRRVGKKLPYFRVSRPDVNMYICFTNSASDAAINEALTDRYGGSKQIAYGNKKNPGPLFGVVSHIKPALALAITVSEDVIPRKRRLSAAKAAPRQPISDI